MSEKLSLHIPVLASEVVQHLITSQDGCYVDATFGRGGHSRKILDELGSAGRLIALDQDEEAIHYAEQYFANEPRFTIQHASFAHLQSSLAAQGITQVDGILFDLGVSSPQLDNPLRGFSFMRTGPLDMRMDTSRGISAAQWLATVAEEELARVLFEYGEERFSRRIAKAIVMARSEAPITTTSALVDIIKSALPFERAGDKHPATRSFQAIRIAVNQELAVLEEGLTQALALLKPGGRLLVISFHSLEDRIVKQFIRHQEKGVSLPRGLPIKGQTFQAILRSIGKPITPSLQESTHNPRARSARLRIAEKLL